MKEEWLNLDFSTLGDPSWPLKEGIFSPENHKERAQEVLGDLKNRIKVLVQAPSNERKDVVVVTHGGFMRDLTDNTRFSLGLASSKACTIIENEEGHLMLKV